MPHTPITINCPKCGLPMQFLRAEDPSGAGFQVYECPEHGVYYFDQNGLMPGTPPPER